MFLHHPSQGRAIPDPILLSQHVCFGKTNVQKICNKISHFLLNLIEQPYFWWIQRVVEIKDPCVDITKFIKVHGILVPNGAVGSMVKRLLGATC